MSFFSFDAAKLRTLEKLPKQTLKQKKYNLQNVKTTEKRR